MKNEGITNVQKKENVAMNFLNSLFNSSIIKTEEVLFSVAGVCAGFYFTNRYMLNKNIKVLKNRISEIKQMG